MSLPLDQLVERASGDRLLARFGRDFSCALLVGDGSNEWLIRIRDGAVCDVQPGPLIMPHSDISLRADEATWRRFLEPVPPPGYHDLFALRRYRRIRIEGDIGLLSAYLFYIKRLFELLREAANS